MSRTCTGTDLALGVRPGTEQHSRREKHHAGYLPEAEPLAPQVARQHGPHAPKRSEDDMHRHRDGKGKRPVVEHVDCVEHGGNNEPPPERHVRLGGCIRRLVRGREGAWPCDAGGKEELNEGDDETWWY